MKTLDEAIKHCEEKAKELNEQLDFIVDDETEKACISCMLEYEQLAKWLKELKALKDRPQGDLISREALKDAFDNLCCHNCKMCRNFRNEDSFYKCNLIENAQTVEPQKIVTIPHELIEKLVLCVVDTVENIDWDKAIEAYKERPQVTVFTETADEKAIEDMKAELESVIEKRPPSEWVVVPERCFIYCKECGHVKAFLPEEFKLGINFPNFCEGCGADMRGTTNEP